MLTNNEHQPLNNFNCYKHVTF